MEREVVLFESFEVEEIAGQVREGVFHGEYCYWCYSKF